MPARAGDSSHCFRLRRIAFLRVGVPVLQARGEGSFRLTRRYALARARHQVPSRLSLRALTETKRSAVRLLRSLFRCSDDPQLSLSRDRSTIGRIEERTHHPGEVTAV